MATMFPLSMQGSAWPKAPTPQTPMQGPNAPMQAPGAVDPGMGGPAPYVDPYQALIDQLEARMQKAPGPMYTPEQVAQRRAQNEREHALGLLGMLSGDEALGGVGGQVFRQALANRQQRVTEHGTADPITGAFTPSPEALRQRDESQLNQLRQKQAAGRQAYDEQRTRAAEREAQAERDRQTRLEVAGIAAGGANASRQGAQDARVWRAEDSLRNDFDKLTKDYREELAAADKVRNTIGAYAGRKFDPMAQQAVVILLNKFLDPGSVVREGEFDRVVKSQGLVPIAQNLLNRVATGSFLTPETTAQIDRLAAVYQEAAGAKLRAYGQNYTTIASARGLDPSMVISDPRWRPAPAAAPVSIDVGAALGKPGKPGKGPGRALPKAVPGVANRMIDAEF